MIPPRAALRGAFFLCGRLELRNDLPGLPALRLFTVFSSLCSVLSQFEGLALGHGIYQVGYHEAKNIMDILDCICLFWRHVESPHEGGFKGGN